MAKTIINLTTTLAVALGLSLALITAPVSAGKPTAPPGQGGRDVITDAEAICGVPPTDTDLVAACELRGETNGELIAGGGCPGPGTVEDPNGITGDAGVVKYLLRNCVKNEESLLRYASSAVLSLDDAVNNDKDNQYATAANYLCGYADKYALLVGADKLVALEDLGEVADDLADAITETEFYCD